MFDAHDDRQVGTSTPLPADEPSLDQLIDEWLAACFARSRSTETRTSYTAALLQFRTLLRMAGLDLDSAERHPPGYSQEQQRQRQRIVLREIRRIAQSWSAHNYRGGASVSSATINKRLSMLSSCYEFLIDMEYLAINPIDRVKRPPVQMINPAEPLEAEELATCLRSIDCSAFAGVRDYTLLLLTLLTGRRLSEVANLRWNHCVFHAKTNRLSITWVRVKGGKVEKDDLEGEMVQLLHSYQEAAMRLVTRQTTQALLALFSTAALDWQWKWLIAKQIFLSLQTRDLPVWVTAANPTTPLSRNGLRAICKRHLGTARFHVLRHTFAVLMEEVGAKPSDIASKLGHKDLSQLMTYLARQRSAKNPKERNLERLLGVQPSGASQPPLEESIAAPDDANSWLLWLPGHREQLEPVLPLTQDRLLAWLKQLGYQPRLRRYGRDKDRAIVALVNKEGRERSIGTLHGLLTMQPQHIREHAQLVYRALL